MAQASAPDGTEPQTAPFAPEPSSSRRRFWAAHCPGEGLLLAALEQVGSHFTTAISGAAFAACEKFTSTSASPGLCAPLNSPSGSATIACLKNQKPRKASPAFATRSAPK